MIVIPKAPPKYDVRDQNHLRREITRVVADIDQRLRVLESA